MRSDIRVSAGMSMCKYVCIVKGASGGNFWPEAEVGRQQAAFDNWPNVGQTYTSTCSHTHTATQTRTLTDSLRLGHAATFSQSLSHPKRALSDYFCMVLSSKSLLLHTDTHTHTQIPKQLESVCCVRINLHNSVI